MAEDNLASSSQTGLSPNVSVLPTHPFIAEVPRTGVSSYLFHLPGTSGFSWSCTPPFLNWGDSYSSGVDL